MVLRTSLAIHSRTVEKYVLLYIAGLLDQKFCYKIVGLLDQKFCYKIVWRLGVFSHVNTFKSCLFLRTRFHYVSFHLYQLILFYLYHIGMKLETIWQIPLLIIWVHITYLCQLHIDININVVFKELTPPCDWHGVDGKWTAECYYPLEDCCITCLFRVVHCLISFNLT